jgi:hypothetical protein
VLTGHMHWSGLGGSSMVIFHIHSQLLCSMVQPTAVAPSVACVCAHMA